MPEWIKLDFMDAVLLVLMAGCFLFAGICFGIAWLAEKWSKWRDRDDA